MKFRPCIDIHNGKVKQIVGSTLTDGKNEPVTNFVSDYPPSHFAEIYKNDDLRGGHVIMLGKGNEQAAIDALGAFQGGFHVGGGITPENASSFLDAGASHVIVTSYIFSNNAIVWEKLSAFSLKVGKNRLVLDLSCKKVGDSYHVATDRWQKITDCVISAEMLQKLASYCDEFLIHAADVEGKRGGIDEELVSLIADASPVKITYAGGIRSVNDLESVRIKGLGRVDATVGSALDLFGGDLSYEDVVRWHRNLNAQ